MDKKALRAEIRAKKRALTAEQIETASAALAERLFCHPLYQNAGAIYLYLSYNQEVLTLPILDEIDASVTVGTAGSSLLAVQAAAKLLDWGENTGLGTDEISNAASTWLAARNNDLTDCLKKLELVDEAYRKLLTDEARELLDSAGCENVEVTWGSDPVEPVEAIMQAAGLRG